MATRFSDQEAEYDAWLASNPGSFVLNTTRTPSANYLILHRATCGSLRLQKGRQLFRTRDYIKVVSTSIPDLSAWARRSVEPGAQLQRCGLCKP